MQRRDRQLCIKISNLNFGRYSRHVNQWGACSSSDVITSGGRKSETTMEDKLMVVVCEYPELYDTTSYFYKNRNTFSNETGAACRNPSHDTDSHLLCSEFHSRMKRVNSKCSSVQLRAIYSLHSHLVWTHLYTGERTICSSDFSALMNINPSVQIFLAWFRSFSLGIFSFALRRLLSIRERRPAQ